MDKRHSAILHTNYPDCINQSTMTVPSRLPGIYSQVDGMDHCSEYCSRSSAWTLNERENYESIFIMMSRKVHRPSQNFFFRRFLGLCQYNTYVGPSCTKWRRFEWRFMWLNFFMHEGTHTKERKLFVLPTILRTLPVQYYVGLNEMEEIRVEIHMVKLLHAWRNSY